MRLRGVLTSSIPIQAAGGIALVGQGVLAPWLYGREAFGLAVSAMALPYLLVGLLEPVVVSVLIRGAGRTNGTGSEGRLAYHTAIVFAGGSVAIAAIPWLQTSSVFSGLTLFVLLTFVLMWFATVALAWAYREGETRRLALAYSAHALGLVGGLLLFRCLGATGIVLALTGAMVIFVACLGRPVRLAVKWLAAVRGPAVPWRLTAAQYLAALAPKAGLLWLNAGIFFFATFFLTARELASLKLNQSLAFASLHALPISGYVLQAHAARSEQEGPAAAEGRARGVLVLFAQVLVFCAAIAVALWLGSPWIERQLLGVVQGASYRILAWAVPGVVTMSLFGSLLFASGADRSLRFGALTGFLASVAVLFSGHVAAALIAGAYVIAAHYVYAYFNLQRRR